MKLPDIVGKKHKYKHNDFDKETFHLKSTVMYGKSKTGKSFLLNELLKQLADEFFLMLCFAETAEIDKDFPMTKYTPYPCIYKGLYMEKLASIFAIAEKKMSIYRMCRELDRLEEAAKIVKKINNTPRYAKIIKAIRKQKSIMSSAENKSELVEAEERIIGLYRVMMNETRIFVKQNKIDLSEFEPDYTICITQCKLNPYILIVFNDLGDEIKNLSKKDRAVLDGFFNKGRHFGITIVLLLQNPQQLSKSQRQLVNNNIFTTTEAINQYVECVAGGRELRKKIDDAVECIVTADERRMPKDKQYSKILIADGDIQFVRGDKMGEQVIVGKPRFHEAVSHITAKPESKIIDFI
jgi:hypothetical protein